MTSQIEPAAWPAPHRAGTLIHGQLLHRYGVPLAVAGAVTGALVLRTVYVPTYLTNWDAVQFALGVERFNVIEHRPHPPGYVLYIGAAVTLRRLLALAGLHLDAAQVLVLLSLIASAVAVPLVFLVARTFAGSRTAVLTALLFTFSPLSWYYSVTALTYTVECTLALMVVWLCWHGAHRAGLKPVVASAVVLGLAGGVRQSTLILLLPLWLYATWAGGRCRLFAGLLTVGVVCLAWFIPLIVLSGGLQEYLAASRRLSSIIMQLTSIFGHGLPAAAANLQYIAMALLSAHGIGLAFFVPLVLGQVRWSWELSTFERRLLALWIVPPLLFFVLVHVGQAGYLLFILPATLLLQAVAILATGASLEPVVRRFLQGLHRQLSGLTGRLNPLPQLHASMPEFLAAVVALTGAAVFLWSDNDLSLGALAENDRFWKQVQALRERYPPETTVIFTGMLSSESYRHAFYYLPDYQVYGVGFDSDGELGVLFEARHGWGDYTAFLSGRPARRTLLLPQPTYAVVYLDEPLTRLMEPERHLTRLALTPRRSVYVYEAERSINALRFRRPAEPLLAGG